MSRALCPECAQGKCGNCTGEAMDGEVLVACGCLEPYHLGPMENEVYRLIEGSAIGVTVPEIRSVLGIKEPAVPIGKLLNTGHVVRRGDAREGWGVYVAHSEVPGPQIDAQSVEDKQEGTDMGDDKDEREGTRKVHQIRPGAEYGEEVSVPAPRHDKTSEVTWTFSNVEGFARRTSALERARAILGEEQKGSGPLTHPTKTPPAVDDLLRLSVYIDTGVVLGDALGRKFGTADD